MMLNHGRTRFPLLPGLVLLLLIAGVSPCAAQPAPAGPPAAEEPSEPSEPSSSLMGARVVPWQPLVPIEPEASRALTGAHQTGIFHQEHYREANGRERSYRMVVPENYRPERPIGILFGFQGGGGPATYDLLWKTGFEDFAEPAYWIAVTPGIEDGTWDFSERDETRNRDLELVQAILARLRSLYSIDENRLCVMGYCNGAAFVQFLGLVYPTLFAAIVPVNAPVAMPLRAGADYACIAAGGTRDADYHSAEHNRTMMRAFAGQGLDMACHEYPIEHRWPRDTNPRSFTEIAVKFLRDHPRGYRMQARESDAPRTAEAPQLPISENFDDSRPPALAQKECFDAEGAFIRFSHCDLSPRVGALRGHTCATPGHGLCLFSEAFFAPARWRVQWTAIAITAESEVYPLVLRNGSGRVAALAISATGWRWLTAETALAFRRAEPGRLRHDAAAPLALAPGTPCALEATLDAARAGGLQWRLLDGSGQALAEGTHALPEGDWSAASFGLGLRGPGTTVDFDQVDLAYAYGVAANDRQLVSNYLGSLDGF